MKIGFVWDGNYPWDIRVEKICLSLIDAGHEVHMVCRNTKFQERYEQVDGIYIHRLPFVKYSNILNQLINFPFFFNPVWYKNIEALFNKEDIGIVIVRDITLSLTALKAAKKKEIPVILDMAEPYPEMIKAQHVYGDTTGIKKFIRNIRMAEWVEKKTLEKSAHIFAMVEESKERMLSMGILQDKISIVSNTPDLRRFRKGRASYPGSMSKLKSNTIFLYVGFIDMYRGLQIAIQGFRKVVEKDPKSVLVIVGNGRSEEKIKKLTRKLELEEHIVFEGYQDHSLVPDYIASCDVGIIPHFSCGLWNNTVPNKLFDYMAMSKPVLSSDAKPVKRILEGEKCGIAYSNNDPSEFGRQAVKLLDFELRNEMGNNGLKSIKRRYNWGIDSKEMLRRIEITASKKTTA